MYSKTALGKQGEAEAAKYLQLQGFQLLRRNYRYRRSEIDLIVLRNNQLVFVEVKTKSQSRFGAPEAAIDQKKIRMLLQGAEHYILEQDWRGPIRFDVISVKFENGTWWVCYYYF